jgi:hypothetical protein
MDIFEGKMFPRGDVAAFVVCVLREKAYFGRVRQCSPRRIPAVVCGIDGGFGFYSRERKMENRSVPPVSLLRRPLAGGMARRRFIGQRGAKN